MIDFGDISIGDPDYDLAFLGRRLGSTFIAELLRHLPRTESVRLAEKIRCFNLFNAIGDVFIGLDRGDRPLLDSSLADLTDQHRALGSLRVSHSVALTDSLSLPVAVHTVGSARGAFRKSKCRKTNRDNVAVCNPAIIPMARDYKREAATGNRLQDVMEHFRP